QANPAVPNLPAFPKLTAEQIDPVRAFLKAADMAGDLLASDDLPGFLGAAPKVKLASDQLLRVFPADDPWRALALVAQEKSVFPAAADIKAARRQFHPFSQAAVSMALALRRAEKDFSELKVFRCPMTKDAFEGAPRRVEWIQLKDSVRNPYFGAEMLDCGAEVKP
ncbi:MAG: DUF3347 domain-containing protein, partial [Verrucomicrobia bacterium]|nr:DUF3347 domain-containing protein [Verrucomicrobiota bacterium]